MASVQDEWNKPSKMKEITYIAYIYAFSNVNDVARIIRARNRFKFRLERYGKYRI